MFCLSLNLILNLILVLSIKVLFLLIIIVQRGKNVILHSHSEVQPNNTLLVQHLLVQSLLSIQTSYSFST
ncbi:hypothetical protein Hanom_Chr12g01085951 [Helianthus anomalus]